ncbi:MAG: gluconate 2-dehydrogenase gamma chain [Actinomycetota bacterium]
MLAAGNLGNLAGLWNSDERDAVAAALDDLVPGASELGAVDYVEGLLTAFSYDPPRIWAGPSGWLELGPWEEHAWRERIAAWREVYDRVTRREHAPGDGRVLFAHACEATYGDPVYGGNQDQGGWQRINFPAPMFPPHD